MYVLEVYACIKCFSADSKAKKRHTGTDTQLIHPRNKTFTQNGSISNEKKYLNKMQFEEKLVENFVSKRSSQSHFFIEGPIL
jgi:hypothetical protein